MSSRAQDERRWREDGTSHARCEVRGEHERSRARARRCRRVAAQDGAIGAASRPTVSSTRGARKSSRGRRRKAR